MATQEQQALFSRLVHEHFDTLRARGMDPNEAAALALKTAAGLADMPPTISSLIAALEAAKASGEYQGASTMLFRFFSSADALQAAFLAVTEGSQCPLDFQSLNAFYGAIIATRQQAVTDTIGRAIDQLLPTLLQLPAAVNPGLPRQLAILLANPMLYEVEYHGLVSALAHFVVGLSTPQRRDLMNLFSTFPAAEMRKVVMCLQSFITLTLYQAQTITRGVEDTTRLLAVLHEANDHPGRMLPPLPYEEFYNDAVNNDDFNLKEDLRRWKHPFKYDFAFCKYPFMYDPASKAKVLQMENQMAQISELQSALFRGLFNAGAGGMADMCPFLVLKVRRGPYLVQDTLIQINRAKETDSLKKPLKVKFIGEEGVDEGGVQKEFFQLLVRELFNPDYGMFTYDHKTRFNWFRPSHLDMDTEFELVGILIGLAIYNSHILEFQFPTVLYKKLMQGPGEAAAVNVQGCVVNSEGRVSSSSSTGGSAEDARATAGASTSTSTSMVGLQSVPSSSTPASAAVPAVPGVSRSSSLSASAAAAGSTTTSGGAAAAATAGRTSEGPLVAGGGALAAGGSVGGGIGASGLLSLDDLQELHPEVHASLGKLLAAPAEDVESWGLYFQVSLEMGFGEVEVVDLVPGGGDVPVTGANRLQYVALYVHHLLNSSVARQFGAFQSGFLRLCSGAALAWFKPQELELLVCGGRQLDLAALQGATVYDDGYTKDSEPVVWFWEVVHSWGEEDKKRLLAFVTGSDRVPIKGLAALNPPFVISRAGAHSDRLPSAHTCFNHLLLPHYNSREVLKERLELAIRHAEGFGLM